MSNDDKNFEFIVLTGTKRFTFNAKYFRNPIFDTKIFNIADQLLVGYEGGYWEYCLWNNAVPFYRLANDEGFQSLVNPHSGEGYVMDASLAGMIITLYALCMALVKNPIDKGTDQLNLLKDLIYEYASEIGQFEQAYGMID